MRKRTRSVSFRLSEDVLELLIERASEVNLSHGEMARSIVISSLCGAPSDEQLTKLEQLEGGLQQLLDQVKRTDKKLAYMLLTILTQLGNIDRDRAVSIVKAELLRQEA